MAPLWGVICLLAVLTRLAVDAVVNTTNCGASDQALWRSSEFAIVEPNLQKCGLESLGQPNSARACLRPLSSLSDTCLECQVTLIVCTGQNCALQCANGARSNPKCVDCVENGSPCNTNFLQCSNLPFPTCSECVQPAKADKGFIPGLSLGASIGVVVGASGAGIIVTAFIIYCFCIRDRRVEFNPSQHSMHDLGASSPNLGKGSSFHTNGSPMQTQLKLYANSDDMNAPAYSLGQNGSTQMKPFDPIMNEI